MSFSVKLSDMERQITSYEKKIQRQTAEIDQLSAKLDSKAERTQFQNLEILLNSKMVTLKDEINTKDLVIERYRNKLRDLEGEVTVRELVHKCAINPFRDALCTRVRWGGVGFGGFSNTLNVSFRLGLIFAALVSSLPRTAQSPFPSSGWYLRLARRNVEFLFTQSLLRNSYRNSHRFFFFNECFSWGSRKISDSCRAFQIH